MHTVVVLVALAFSSTVAERAPRHVASDEIAAADPDSDSDDDGPSYFERWSPFSIDDGLQPMVDDNLFVFFLGGLLFPIAGNVWIPALFVGEPPPGYWSDALLSWFFHVVALVVVGVVLGAASAIFQPLAAATAPLMFVFLLANAFYLVPVATINAYDRGLRPPSSKKSTEGGQKDPERARNENDDDPPPAWMKDGPKPLPDVEPPPSSEPPPTTGDPSEAPDDILRF